MLNEYNFENTKTGAPVKMKTHAKHTLKKKENKLMLLGISYEHPSLPFLLCCMMLLNVLVLDRLKLDPVLH